MSDFKKPKMNNEYIIQNDIVGRYLRNKLTADEIIAFEEYAMDKPELLEQLELDSVLMETLPKAYDAKHQKTVEKNDIMSTFWQVIVGTPARASLGTFAFCLVCAMSLNVINNGSSLESNYGKQGVEIVYISALRSGDDNLEHELPSSRESQNIVLVLQSQLMGFEDFSVSILNDQGTSLFNEALFKANSDGDVVITLSNAEITKQKLTIELYPIKDPSLLSKFVVKGGQYYD
jgi:hypothetical protein